jgi:uncharacterized protein YbjT (DUF2867 family)
MPPPAKRVTVFGASGTVGVALIGALTAAGHHATPTSRATGVDVTTGAGVIHVLDGADVLVDVINTPVRDSAAAEDFFTVAATTLTDAARTAAVAHYVVPSIVGVEGIAHLHGKQMQERLIAGSGLDYTIVRATQFHEFADLITTSMTQGGAVVVPDATVQPIAVADVAAVLARIAGEQPRNGILDVAGPEVMTFAALVSAVLDKRQERTAVIVDPHATYFGTPLARNSLIPTGPAELTTTRLADWLARR